MSLRIVAGETPEAVPLGERLGADRLLGADVVLDDGAQHLEPAFVEHAHLPRRPAWRRRDQAGTHLLGVPSLGRRSPECGIVASDDGEEPR